MELIMDYAILFEDDNDELNMYVNYVRRPYTIDIGSIILINGMITILKPNFDFLKRRLLKF